MHGSPHLLEIAGLQTKDAAPTNLTLSRAAVRDDGMPHIAKPPVSRSCEGATTATFSSNPHAAANTRAQTAASNTMFCAKRPLVGIAGVDGIAPSVHQLRPRSRGTTRTK